MKKHIPFALGSPAFIWQALFFYAPLFLLVATSFYGGGANYSPLFSWVYLKIILATMALCFGTALLCLILAYPVAHFIAFHGKRYKYLLLFFLIVPFWTNFLLHVYAWFFILGQDGYINQALSWIGLGPYRFFDSLFAVVLMMIYTYIPFMVLPLYSSLDRFNSYLLEASISLGASKMQTMKNILLPMTLPAMRTGFFLVMIPSFGEFIIPELMGGDRVYFVGNVISQYVLGEETAGMGAAFTVLSALALVTCIFIVYQVFAKLEKRYG